MEEAEEVEKGGGVEEVECGVVVVDGWSRCGGGGVRRKRSKRCSVGECVSREGKGCA